MNNLAALALLSLPCATTLACEPECAREPVPVWPLEDGYWDGTRLSLDELCGARCQRVADGLVLQCASEDALPDAGLDEMPSWRRVTGCDHVQLHYGYLHAQSLAYYLVDQRSGKVLGLATWSDSASRSPDGTCEDAVFVAGKVDLACDDVVTERCREFPPGT